MRTREQRGGGEGAKPRVGGGCDFACALTQSSSDGADHRPLPGTEARRRNSLPSRRPRLKSSRCDAWRADGTRTHARTRARTHTHTHTYRPQPSIPPLRPGSAKAVRSGPGRLAPAPPPLRARPPPPPSSDLAAALLAPPAPASEPAKSSAGPLAALSADPVACCPRSSCCSRSSCTYPCEGHPCPCGPGSVSCGPGCPPLPPSCRTDGSFGAPITARASALSIVTRA